MKHQAYCSFCSLPQKVYHKKHVNFFDLLMFATVSMIATYLIWNEFHIAGPILFIIFASLAEWTHRLRWRHSIKCKSCGFDPLLYKHSPAEAASTVKAFLDNRKKDPLYLLRAQPRIKPIIKKVKKYSTPIRSKELDI